MLVHNYDPGSGVWVSSQEARESPLEPGVYLIPAHATDAAPPLAAPGQVAVFDPAARVWSLAEDHRGETWYGPDGHPTVLDMVGPIPAGLIEQPLTPPTPAPTDDDVRTEASRRMQHLVGARNAAHLDIILSNGTREAVRLLRIGATNWTPEESARAAMLEAVDTQIEAIRAASNVVEAMTPIPADYADDSRWP